MPSDQEENDSRSDAKWFTTTHWSVVLAARDGGSPRALERLCRTYWRPLYVYARRRGYRAEEAEDLTQEFFARLLEKDYLAHLRHQQGKFRSFLLTFFNHFLSDEWHKARTQKRGGRTVPISLDALSADERDHLEPAAASVAERAFDRSWARTVLDRAVARLGEEYVAAGKGIVFERLKDLQFGECGGPSYAELAERLGMTESALKSAAHRLRLRHREMLREEVAGTVTRPEEIDEEIRYLISVLSG